MTGLWYIAMLLCTTVSILNNRLSLNYTVFGGGDREIWREDRCELVRFFRNWLLILQQIARPRETSMDVEGNKTFLVLGLLTLIHFTHAGEVSHNLTTFHFLFIGFTELLAPKISRQNSHLGNIFYYCTIQTDFVFTFYA